MAYQLEFRPRALEQLNRFRKYDQVRILAECDLQLRNNPSRTSKSRIKQLEGYAGYRLRVDEFRVFYTVDEVRHEVVIHGVVPKTDATNWLVEYGVKLKGVESDETGNGKGS